MRGYNNSTGIGLVEVYDTSIGSTQLGNISTRGFVQTGDNVMIAGLVAQSHSKQVVVRAPGPTLTGFGITSALPDPTLSLYDGNGALLVFNDDWRDTQESSISGTGTGAGKRFGICYRGNTSARELQRSRARV